MSALRNVILDSEPLRITTNLTPWLAFESPAPPESNMMSSNTAISRSTVLLALFSPDFDTTQVLDNFLKQFQDGLNASSSSIPPDVFCLYRKESVDALQFKLTKSGAPVSGSSYGGSMKDQLIGFFESADVKDALETNGRTYLIIGAHGSPFSGDLGITILMKMLFLIS